MKLLMNSSNMEFQLQIVKQPKMSFILKVEKKKKDLRFLSYITEPMEILAQGNRRIEIMNGPLIRVLTDLEFVKRK
jgi:hypothetical protein